MSRQILVAQRSNQLHIHLVQFSTFAALAATAMSSQSAVMTSRQHTQALRCVPTTSLRHSSPKLVGATATHRSSPAVEYCRTGRQPAMDFVVWPAGCSILVSQ
jgi:hypothetical protein